MYSWVTLEQLRDWCQGQVLGNGTNHPVKTLCTDSRTIKRGDVFLALKGESFDGHEFLAEAESRGAMALISEKKVNAKIPVLLVKDTLKALIQIGSGLRNEFQGKVIGVTGSAGKSSTKEMLAVLMGPHTVASPASFNNLMGVSRTLCLVNDDTRHLVLEMGMNDFGEIATLCETFRPQAGIITNIGDAHIGKLGGKDGIYRAKKEMFEYLSLKHAEAPLGVALNLDDALVEKAYQESFKSVIPTVTYSLLGKPADVHVRQVEMDPNTAFLKLQVQVRKEAFEVTLPLFGLHHAQNLAAATAGALLLGESLTDIRSRYAHLQAASHRGEMHLLKAGALLIDESYNSNPSALLSSLTSLFAVSPKRRRILILGDMFELGDFSESLHTEVGKSLCSLLQKNGTPAWVLGVGKWVRHLIQPLKAGLSGVEASCVETAEEVWPLLKSRIQPQDLLFVKGSRGVKLDKVVAAVKASLGENRG